MVSNYEQYFFRGNKSSSDGGIKVGRFNMNSTLLLIVNGLNCETGVQKKSGKETPSGDSIDKLIGIKNNA